MNILFLILALVALSFVSEVSGLECKRYFDQQEDWAKPLGYCWVWYPGDRLITNTLGICTGRLRGHLPTVDTKDKANKLAEFIKIVAGKYERAELGTNWQLFFRNGNKGWDIWSSPVHSSGNQMIWNSTGTVVSFDMHQKDTPSFQSGTTCTVFSAEKKTWRFSPCESKWPHVCEQGVPETTPPPPQKEEEKEENEEVDDEEEDDDDDDEDSGKCPSGFMSFEHKCFKLGKGTGAVFNFVKYFCKKHGGHMVKLKTQKDYDTVKKYLEMYFTSGAEGAFIDRVTWKKRQMIWTDDQSDASFVKAALKLRFRPRYLRPIYIPRPNLNNDRLLRHCPCCGPFKCRMLAFCEAMPKSGAASHHYEDYY